MIVGANMRLHSMSEMAIFHQLFSLFRDLYGSAGAQFCWFLSDGPRRVHCHCGLLASHRSRNGRIALPLWLFHSEFLWILVLLFLSWKIMVIRCHRSHHLVNGIDVFSGLHRVGRSLGVRAF